MKKHPFNISPSADNRSKQALLERLNKALLIVNEDINCTDDSYCIRCDLGRLLADLEYVIKNTNKDTSSDSAMRAMTEGNFR